MPSTKTDYSNAAIGNQKEILNSIQDNAKNVAIFERSITHLDDQIKKLVNFTISFRESGDIQTLENSLESYFIAHLTEYQTLYEDIVDLLSTFHAIAKASSYVLTFITVDNDMCRKWHTDINNIRMLCTYHGLGTQWIPDEFIKSQNAEKEFQFENYQIQQVRTGDVILMKGALYGESNPLMHRSPKLNEEHNKRLLLRIDTNDMMNF